MKKMKMEQAKMHYEALMSALAALGMSLAEFEDEMNGNGIEKESDEEYGEEMEEGEDMPMKKPMNRAKVAVIVAKMKNKMKG